MLAIAIAVIGTAVVAYLLDAAVNIGRRHRAEGMPATRGASPDARHRARRRYEREPLPVTVSTQVRRVEPMRLTVDLRTREQKLADQARVDTDGFPRYATRPATAA
jgi:hypothetical protein